MVIQHKPTLKVYTVKSNQPFLLLNPQVIWQVVWGQVSVFATQVSNHQPTGERRYLFSVNPGEILCGVRVTQGLGILAVALGEVQLQRLSIDDLGVQFATRDLRAITFLVRLEDWFKQIGDTLTRESSQKTLSPENTVLAPCTLPTPYSLETNQLIQPPTNQIIWVKVIQGKISWQGFSHLILEQDSPWFPLVPGMWLTAETSTEITIIPTFQYLNSDRLTASLEIFHRYVCYALNCYLQENKQAEFDRFQAREQLNNQLTLSAFGQLAGVLEPQQLPLETTGTPLLIAAGAVGRVQKIKIQPPAASEDTSLLQDPVEAIARASQCRIRRVQLVGNWWQQEHGPLLAYTIDDYSPVALLPNQKDKSYLLFDPVKQTRITVTEAVAQTIATNAYFFYRPLPLVVNNIVELFKFGIEGYHQDIILAILIGALATILGMVVPQATGMLIAQIIPDSDRLLLWQIGLALFAAALGQSAFQLSQGIITLRVENATDVNLQLAVWDRLLKITPTFFRQYTSGELVNRLLAIRQIRSQLSGASQRTLLSGIFSLLNLALMFIYSIKLALIGLGISILAIIVTITSGTLLVRKERQQEKLDGEIDGLTVQLIGGVAKLRVAAAEERAFATWAAKYSQKTKLTFGIQGINDAVSTFNEALPLISSVLLFWFAILFIQLAQAQGNPTGLTAGTFLAFNAAFGTFISGVTDLSNTLTDVLGIVPLWERAKSIVQAPTEYDPHRTDAGRLAGRVVLDRITFRYRKDGAPILDNVCVEANPGEFIALVGPSGSGKSTLFRLLLGFEIPQSGTVYYDGQDLTGLDVISVRRQLGVVLQNGRVQQSSIFDNIACGALITLKEAWKAAEMAGLAEDIAQMPMEMHTVVSEGGSNLSGGQRQRLLIARALIGNPKIILMDEATSALDNRTQAVVTQSLETLSVTRIVIAHRLSTIRHADRIYVLEAGRVVQAGSFAELVAQSGLFARLVARQLE
ncbi:NHLP bacteriocin export ABC transporter permease/ATPase subunit [Hyella patelloides LEGE 07179]|uniref:NHLP bacteriocin export ABC transporter permease/ATPase subunit n=1 Tax=Hyella patelloides LEGE 07179 TaxID=945734 RepID=A0A563W4K0_9CYAN|nr:NHLP bacteriocin export ABC transporter permease/ATPase subunit [Hyella patelloides]VEP18570.1 NHLP bacteriocin export ABC transporter permease/ATPase subunit [Hyella patelloides LEGE 07179]